MKRLGMFKIIIIIMESHKKKGKNGKNSRGNKNVNLELARKNPSTFMGKGLCAQPNPKLNYPTHLGKGYKK